MAYVFDRRKVSFRGIAGEITLKPEDLVAGGKLSELALPDGSKLRACRASPSARYSSSGKPSPAKPMAGSTRRSQGKLPSSA